LRFTPGPPPASPTTSCHGPLQRSRSASPALFRLDVGNGTPPLEFDSHCDDHDDGAYLKALIESDTCDNSSCPGGLGAPARYTITVEAFDDGLEEFYDRKYRACAACNRACKKSFLGCRIKSRLFDNSVKDNHPHIESATARELPNETTSSVSRDRKKQFEVNKNPVPGSAAYARQHPAEDVPSSDTYSREHPADATVSPKPPREHATGTTTLNNNAVADDGSSLGAISALQDALRTLNARPPTPAAFPALLGLYAANAVAFSPLRSLDISPVCSKLWMPTDAVASIRLPARRFYGGAGSNPTSSPEPDIWTPSPRSSPDEIDDLTARAALPLPASRSESDASRAPSRASSVDEPVNVAATPLPTPDYSSLPTESVDGFLHPSFPERAILDDKDKRHFLGRGDLSVTSLKLYARPIFTETSHWITAGHFLVDIFQGSTINGSRDDFRRFVILVGTQLGFGDLAQSMSESIDVNRKMADEYMRLRDVATTWKQKAKTNSKDAREGRKARDELSKARGDITAILEERDIFIRQRQELLKRDDDLSTELSRVHRDYSNAIDDNTKFAADIESLEHKLAEANDQLDNTRNLLSIAEHHRDKAEHDCGDAVHRFDKSEADRKRDKAFYEARIAALASAPVPTSQPDSEAPLSAAAIDRSVLMTRLENMKKELSARDASLAKLRSEVSLSDDVNTLRAELAEAKAVAARLSGMYEQKSKDFRDSELERLALLGKQILADGTAPKQTPPARPRPASRRGRQRSRSAGRSDPPPPARNERTTQEVNTPPSSQPFWQDEPLFTKHVAAVTTATMSALPHLPFEAAIASAFTTVRNVGPPPPLKLDKKPGNRHSGAPSPPTPQPPAAVASSGNLTFADMVKAATAAAAGTDNADGKKKPTWRAIETSKALAIRPSTKGTRVSELHLRVPKTAESADLFKLKGTTLLDKVAKLINDHSEPAPRMALRENPLVYVKWSMRGNLVLKCAKPMDDLIKNGIKDAITYFFPSPSVEILILNKPPTTAIVLPRSEKQRARDADIQLIE
ncbi:hypothetical protein AX14_004694, partial [Amanita brunnescens Koide BX004]